MRGPLGCSSHVSVAFTRVGVPSSMPQKHRAKLWQPMQYLTTLQLDVGYTLMWRTQTQTQRMMSRKPRYNSVGTGALQWRREGDGITLWNITSEDIDTSIRRSPSQGTARWHHLHQHHVPHGAFCAHALLPDDVGSHLTV